MKRRSNKISDFESFVAQGRGQGRYEKYVPWLEITDVPSIATRSRVFSRKFGRIVHLLSHSEKLAFYILEWNDAVVEIREQFPLDPKLTKLISQELGYKHPGYTRGDTVMTTDFLVTYCRNGEISFKAYQVKASSEDIEDRRTHEKLLIEQNYWRRHGIDYGVILKSDFNRTQTDNLHYLFGERNCAVNASEMHGYQEEFLRWQSNEPQMPIGALDAGVFQKIRLLAAHKLLSFPVKDKPFLSCRLNDFVLKDYACQ